MASPRKSFIIHIDSLDVLDELTDAECGELFRAIKAHHTHEEFKTNTVVRIAFSQFKGQFNRDQSNWEKVAESNRANGLKGGRPKGKKTNPDKPIGLIRNPDNPNEGVSVSVSVSGSKEKHLCNEVARERKKKEKIPFDKFYSNYPKKVDKQKCSLKWNNLTKSDQLKAIAGIKPFVAGKEKQYIASPTVYLNGKRWEDEPDGSVLGKTKGWS